MIEFVLAATLLLRDPPGDAVGAGSLTPPTAEQYRNVGSFDLLEVQVPDTTMLSLSIEMGALPNPAGLSNGFSNPIIDVYVDAGDGGAAELLPGPQMRMPPGRGWEFAVRITGDGATAYRADDTVGGADAAISYPVQVDVEDRRILVSTPFERPEIRGVYAITGVYDPFTQDGWRPVASSPSPWAFSSATQRRPVVDVLARDLVAQTASIRDGVLPLPRNRIGGAMWMVLMALGLVVAGLGLLLRRMVGASGATAAAPGPSATAAGDATSVVDDTKVVSADADVATPPAQARADADGASADGSIESGAVSLPAFLPALPAPQGDAATRSKRAWDGEHRSAWDEDEEAHEDHLGRWGASAPSQPAVSEMPQPSAEVEGDDTPAEPDDDGSAQPDERPRPESPT